jgi:outer membrane protein assembly factor BamB
MFLFLIAAMHLLPAVDPGQWPKWRGPDDNGMARTGAPLRWSDTENIKWKAAIPGRGHSSPVVWGDRIFVTTAVPTAPAPADGGSGGPPAEGRAGGRPGGKKGGPGRGGGPQAEQKFELICLDRKTGKVLWQQTAKVATPHEGYHPRYGSFASNSPVTDGKHVWAFFGSRGVFCYDLNGKLIWEKDLGVRMKMRLGFGEGTAPVVAGDTLILNFDQEEDSFILALDKNTGKQLWRNSRDEHSAWSMPLVIDYKGAKQVVVTATNKVRSYDLGTGRLIWECAGLGVNAIPAPVIQDDVVYVMTGFRDPNLMAIRLGRTGDLTGTDAVLWTNTRGNSYTPSPVLYDNKLYTLTDTGMLSCYNAKTGVPYYQMTRLPKPYSFKSSPVGAGGKLYMASEDGDVVVVRMGEKFEVLATNTMNDEFFVATPAIVDGEIYLRGQNTIYCISDKR